MKSLSPFISAILIIALTVAVAGIVANWFSSYSKTTTGAVETTANQTYACLGLIRINSIDCIPDGNGLVAYYNFDQGAGTVLKDISGNGNDGTLVDANASNADGNTPPQWVSGKYGYGLEFDGVDDYVEVADSPSLNPTDAITVEAWVKLSNLANAQAIVSKTQLAGYSLYWNAVDFPSEFSFWVRIGDSYYTAHIGGGVVANEWYHVVGTYDGSQVKIYKNGQEALGDTISGSIVISSEDLLIGQETPPGSGNYFNGTIDEVRIYNRALSPEEIKALYLRGLTLRSMISNLGSANLGKNFSITYTIGKYTKNLIYTLQNDFKPGSIANLNISFLNISGQLKYFEIQSMQCPQVKTQAYDFQLAGKKC